MVHQTSLLYIKRHIIECPHQEISGHFFNGMPERDGKDQGQNYSEESYFINHVKYPLFDCCLKKNLTHLVDLLSIPESGGGGGSKRLVGGIMGCKEKTSSWPFNGFPSGSDIWVNGIMSGEIHCYTVPGTLTFLIAMQEHQKTFNKQKHCSTYQNQKQPNTM